VGELTIFLILALMFAFAWHAPEFHDQDLRFIDARVFWCAVACGVIVSALGWSVDAVRSHLQSRGRR